MSALGSGAVISFVGFDGGIWPIFDVHTIKLDVLKLTKTVA